MTLENFTAYILTIFIATILPGPSMLLALKDGHSVGVKKSLVTCGGYLLANLIMAIISIVGLGAIIVASGAAFNLIKYAGSVYLIYMGIKIWFSEGSDISFKQDQNKKNKSNYRLFSQGFAVAAGNPKGIVFFTALFPQFINLHSSKILEYFIIFIPLIIVAVSCFVLYAVFGSKIISYLNNIKVLKFLNRSIALYFVGAGISFLADND